MDPTSFMLHGGRVTHWDLGAIDLALPLATQRDALHEDLAQVAFSSGALLDVGWYGGAGGRFTVMVVVDQAWDRPVWTAHCASLHELPGLVDAGARRAAQWALGS